MTEQEIADGCRYKSRIAQHELYRVYSDRLMAICVRYMGDRDEAEDLLHESFIKIYHTIYRFDWRGEGSLRAWIERVTVNSAIERLRKQKRDIMVPSMQHIDPAEEQIEESMVEEIGIDRLYGFIEELPDGYRTIFNMYCIDGYSHKDIAQELGISHKSSASQLSRARATLAKRIKEYINNQRR